LCEGVTDTDNQLPLVELVNPAADLGLICRCDIEGAGILSRIDPDRSSVSLPSPIPISRNSPAMVLR